MTSVYLIRLQRASSGQLGMLRTAAAWFVIHRRDYHPMKKRLLRLLCATAVLVIAFKADARVTMHGREELHCSGWSAGLTAIVNHPARLSGQVGPLGPLARFQFAGDTDVFNQVLAQ